MMRLAQKTLFLSAVVLLFGFSIFAQAAKPVKVLLIPLDDRPPCLQFPVMMGFAGNAEVVTPPREILGRFTDFGKSDAIIEWLNTQDLKSFDAAIVSVDMLSYGGLVAMRVNQTDETTAMKRLGFLREMRKSAPKLKIYGSSVIMRIAPTGTLENEKYRANLAEWAEISVDEKRKDQTAELERKIPAEALADYKAARARDLKVNLETINLVREKTIDYLILSQDDAKPKGIHIADREKLIAETQKLNLTDKIAIQPGADEVSMLLLARALSGKYRFQPKIKAVYSSEALSNQVMPYEDRALKETVSFHIKAVGGREVKSESDADILFYVFLSRFEPGRAESFAREIGDAMKSPAFKDRLLARPENKKNKNLIIDMSVVKDTIIADIDVKGDVQGADPVFTQKLLDEEVFLYLKGYASWNTAGNTIGTALPQGVIASAFGHTYNKLAEDRQISEKQLSKLSMSSISSLENNKQFTIFRLLDDYLYHSVIRPQALKMIRENKWNALRLNDDQTKAIEKYATNELNKSVASLTKEIYKSSARECSISDLIFDLPWNRTFEAEINFNLVCASKNKQATGN